MDYFRFPKIKKLLIPISTVFAQGFTFVSNLVAVRLLSPQEFSSFASSSTIVGLLSSLAVAGQLITAREFAANKESVAEINLDSTSKTLQFALILQTLAVCPFVYFGLHLPLSLLLLQYLVTFFAVIIDQYQGKFLGMEANSEYSRVLIYSTGLRTGFMIITSTLFATAQSALLGYAIGGLISVKIFEMHKFTKVFKLEFHLPKDFLAAIRRLFTAEINVFNVAIPVLSVSALSTIDLLVARWFLPLEQAANYAAAAILIKIFFYSGVPFLTMQFPKMARSYSISPLILTWAQISTVGLAILILMFAWPEQILRYLIGDNYEIAPVRILKIALLGLLMSVSQSIIYFGIARNKLNIHWTVWIYVLTLFAFGYKGWIQTVDNQIELGILCQSLLMITLMFIVVKNSRSIMRAQV